MKKRLTIFLLICMFFVFFNTAFALDYIKGTRAMGMGGARVASTDSIRAQYYNPAAFGFMGLLEKNKNYHPDSDDSGQNEKFIKADVDNNDLGRKDWGFGILDFGFRARILEEDVVDIINDFEDVFDSEGLSGEDEINNVLRLTDFVSRAEKLNNQQILSTDISVNPANYRAGNFAVGIDALVCSSFKIQDFTVDTSAVSFNTEAITALGDVNNVTGAYMLEYISGTQETLLLAEGFSADQIDELDYLISEQIQKENIDQEDVEGLVDTFIELTNDVSGDATEANEAIYGKITANSFGVAEIPLSYGYAFNKHVSIGGNLKYMVGQEREDYYIYDDGQQTTGEESKQSSTFGIDLGIMARTNMFNFGLVGRNLNTPKFEAVSGDDIELKPQVCAGVAFIPHPYLTIEADIDLTENESYDGYETRNLAVGAEFDTRLLALRGGIIKNLAVEEGTGMTYSAGVGLNVWLLRLDFAVLFAQDFVTYDDTDIPREIQVGLNVEMDF